MQFFKHRHGSCLHRPERTQMVCGNTNYGLDKFLSDRHADPVAIGFISASAWKILKQVQNDDKK